MNILENVSLQPYNTFGIAVRARYFAEVTAVDDIREIYASKKIAALSKIIIGGGSNILLTKDIDALILKNSIPGIKVIKEDKDYIYVEAGSGVVWHQLVLWCIRNNYGGIENLSLIPGNVGATPMQNIGAYGVELKDVFYDLQAIDVHSLELVHFTKEQCKFGYRESVFKRELKNQYIICAVTLKLTKNHTYHTQYGAIEQELKRIGVEALSIKAISDAVINIRQRKLPDPKMLGNAGSFFKNPEISIEQYEQVKKDNPAIIAYPAANGKMKLAAGWLIEQCGWKGKRVGNTGSHKDQALVLVNYGNAKGEEIFKLALEIKNAVFEKFGITIEPEVNII